MNVIRLAGLAAVLVGLSCVPAFASGVTVGQYDGGNCYPFLCFGSDGGTRFQEQFADSAFSGPLTIERMSLFLDHNEPDVEVPLMDPAVFAIYFSTSTVGFGSMDANFNNNVGGDNTLFGTFTLQGQMPSTLTLTGANSFTFDPSNGRPLLMDIVVTSIGDRACPYCSFFQAEWNGSTVLRSFSNQWGTTTNDASAPVVNFNGVFQDATNLGSGETLGGSATPEPGSLVTLALGVGLMRLTFRRRRQ